MRKIAVYGSLRKGMYNNRRFMLTAKLLGVDTLYGWTMYSLEDYPFITRGDDKVIVEVWEVPDEVAEAIRDMEIGAGYEEETIDTHHGKALIYVFDSVRTGYYERRNRLTQVPNGDWREYCKISNGYDYYTDDNIILKIDERLRNL